MALRKNYWKRSQAPRRQKPPPIRVRELLFEALEDHLPKMPALGLDGSRAHGEDAPTTFSEIGQEPSSLTTTKLDNIKDARQ
eukprot:CAMPEP_0177431336 /NCGR_PEP_ID=MMETSP0368-20130122/76134_1 /TAXON_ID=447022 ORGANISM="Scrippsiella hangoei-like, Strain SHHI-4" /NCGR_SAMPLE_ID=MMETSP0368 /ASSEMBLY_ACC=CAM_ASM_000363 /LENGTH=81 /DNA_ID=CAMNT_0018901987 /DNA_START=351 /DNA_END=596 /DNA_ORIENTATION=-